MSRRPESSVGLLPPWALWSIGGLAAASFLFAIVASILAPEERARESSGANAFSNSAVGHRAFLEWLRVLNVPTLVSRYDSGRRAGAHGVLFALEPSVGTDEGETARFREMLGHAGTAVVVLPKWHVIDDPRQPGWVARAHRVPPATTGAVLAATGVGGRLVDAPRLAGCNAPGAPDVRDAQLLEGVVAPARALITCDGGALLVEIRPAEGRRVLVLSDPDLLSNHGLGRGDNAILLWHVVEQARRYAVPVVLDATFHGFAQAPSAYRPWLERPRVYAVLHAAAAGLLFVWAGVRRFGRAHELPGALASGKSVLIDNTARLLRRGGHSLWLLERYLEGTLQDVLRARHGPEGRLPARVAWLSGLEPHDMAGRGIGALVEEMQAFHGKPASPRSWLDWARRLDRWKKEMQRGARRHQGI